MTVSRTQLVPAILALVLAAGSASAVYTPKSCPPPEQERKHQTFTRGEQPARIRTRQRTPQSDMAVSMPSTTTAFAQADETDASQEVSESNQVMVFTQTGDAGECQICIENGNVTATRNGQPVEARRIHRDSDRVRVMGDNGQEVMVVRVSPDGSGAATGTTRARVVRGVPLATGSRVVRGVQLSPGSAPHAGTVVRAQPAQRRVLRQTTPGNAPQVRILRQQPGGGAQEIPGGAFEFHTAPGGFQGGQSQAFQWTGEFPAAGQGQSNGHAPQVIEMRRHPAVGGRVAPAVPQVRTRVGVPHPPAPPAHPGAPGVAGQVIIMDGNGQQQTFDLGQIMSQHAGQVHGGQGHAGQPQTFTIPGGQGGEQRQVQIMTAPGAHAGTHAGPNGQTFEFRIETDDAAASGAACCDDCTQDGSCCACGSGAAGHAPAHGAGGAQSGAHSFSGTGQIIIDTGNGQPQVIELGDLGGLDLNNLHNHLLELRQSGAQLEGQVEGHLQGLHDHLMHLQGIDGLHGLHGMQGLEGLQGLLQGMDIDAGDFTTQIELELSDALESLEGIDSDQFSIQIQAAVEQALSGMNFDTLGQDIQVQIQQALEEAGVAGHMSGGDWSQFAPGGFTFDAAPDLFSGSTDMIVEVEPGTADPTAHQPANGAHGSAHSGVRAPSQPAPPSPNRVVRVAPQRRLTAGGGIDAGILAAEVQTEQPRVMLGITMGEAPAEVLEQLGLEPGSCIRVESVIDGLPAAEGGLKPGSIIVAFDGESPATTTALRQHLLGLEAGDTLTLEVVRGGRHQQIEIELIAYDADALQAIMEDPTINVEGQPLTFQGFADPTMQGDLQERIRAAVTAMTEGGVTNIDQDALRAQIEAIVRDHVTVMGGQGQPNSTHARRLLMAPGAQAGPNGQMLFVTPDAPPAPQPPSGMTFERHSDVDARLTDLSERLARLEERLDKLTQLLERGTRD